MRYEVALTPPYRPEAGRRTPPSQALDSRPVLRDGLVAARYGPPV